MCHTNISYFSQSNTSDAQSHVTVRLPDSCSNKTFHVFTGTLMVGCLFSHFISLHGKGTGQGKDVLHMMGLSSDTYHYEL